MSVAEEIERMTPKEMKYSVRLLPSDEKGYSRVRRNGTGYGCSFCEDEKGHVNLNCQPDKPWNAVTHATKHHLHACEPETEYRAFRLLRRN